ncbi:MAG: VOC family protein, partial [Thiohalomonadales bacterium]
MQKITRFFGVLTIVAVTLGGCAHSGKMSQGGTEMAQVPVTESPSGEIYAGKFIWHDLVTPDIQLAGKFYEKLFGWTIEYKQNYAVVRNGDKLIAGILNVEPAAGETRDAVWIPTVSVADVDATVKLVEANGGKVRFKPVDLEKRGRAALISDPQQADLVLLNAKGGDPSEAEAAIGDWLWDEIWTHDPKTTEQFYRNVLGYDEVVAAEAYSIFMKKGKWRAGIRHAKDDNEHMLWVPVVRVAD